MYAPTVFAQGHTFNTDLQNSREKLLPASGGVGDAFSFGLMYLFKDREVY